MKYWYFSILTGFLLVSSSPANQAQVQLRIQVEWIELSHEDYTSLMKEESMTDPATPRSSNNGPLREKLQKMIEGDDATLLDTAMVVARSGQRAKVESILEVIYPTEYLAGKKTETAEKGTKSTISRERQNEGFMPVATAFETRNVGTTLEVDPVLGADGRTVDLSMSPEIVYRAGEEVYGEYRKEESEVHVLLPTFYTMKVTTQATMIVGEYCLVGTQSPLDQEEGRPYRERKVMVFVKADLIQVGTSEKK